MLKPSAGTSRYLRLSISVVSMRPLCSGASEILAVPFLATLQLQKEAVQRKHFDLCAVLPDALFLFISDDHKPLCLAFALRQLFQVVHLAFSCFPRNGISDLDSRAGIRQEKVDIDAGLG